MDEQDLIRKFNFLYDQRHNLQGSVRWHRARQLNLDEVNEKLFATNREITELEEILKNFGNSSAVDRYYNLIEQLRTIHDALIKDQYGNSIDPDQHLIIKGYLFIEIAKLMRQSIDNLGLNLSGFKVLADEFDHQPLKDYLAELIVQLTHNPAVPRNYIELFDFVKQLQSEYWEFMYKIYPDYL